LVFTTITLAPGYCLVNPNLLGDRFQHAPDLLLLLPRAVAAVGMRRETSRVSFRMCLFCVRALVPGQATRFNVAWNRERRSATVAVSKCAAIGLALGILASLTTDVLLAPEAVLVIGLFAGWLSCRMSTKRGRR
jgi:hypothetical protein